MTAVRWEARISRSEHKYHRVEVAGAGPEADPIALVPDPKHATAIAALPDLANAARAVLLFHSGSPWDEAKQMEWRNLTGFLADATTKSLCDFIRSALAKMEGR